MICDIKHGKAGECFSQKCFDEKKDEDSDLNISLNSKQHFIDKFQTAII